MLRRNGLISLKLPLLKGDVTDNRSVHIKLISVLIISSPVGLQEAFTQAACQLPRTRCLKEHKEAALWVTPGPVLAVISQHLSAWRQSFTEVFSFTEHQKKFSKIKRDTVHLWEGYCCCISCRHYISKAGIFWQATAGVLWCCWWVLGLQWSCEESNAPKISVLTSITTDAYWQPNSSCWNATTNPLKAVTYSTRWHPSLPECLAITC